MTCSILTLEAETREALYEKTVLNTFGGRITPDTAFNKRS